MLLSLSLLGSTKPTAEKAWKEKIKFILTIYFQSQILMKYDQIVLGHKKIDDTVQVTFIEFQK